LGNNTETHLPEKGKTTSYCKATNTSYYLLVQRQGLRRLFLLSRVCRLSKWTGHPLFEQRFAF